jgi:hypothetical protein
MIVPPKRNPLTQTNPGSENLTHLILDTYIAVNNKL